MRRRPSRHLFIRELRIWDTCSLELLVTSECHGSIISCTRLHKGHEEVELLPLTHLVDELIKRFQTFQVYKQSMALYVQSSWSPHAEPSLVSRFQ